MDEFWKAIITPLIEEGYVKLVIYGFGSVASPFLVKWWKSITGGKLNLNNLGKRVSFWCLVPVVCFISLVCVTLIAQPSPSRITGMVKQCGIGASDSIDSSIVVFHLRLSNSGKPSVAWNWKAVMTLAGGQVYTSSATDYPTAGDFKMVPAIGGQPTNNVSLGAGTYLPNVLLERAVTQERGADGWVLFRFAGVPESTIKRPGTQFIIQFEQSDGSKRSIRHLWNLQ